MTQWQPPIHEQGFTVVEALIATAIVATMTGLFYQLLSSNVGVAQKVTDRRTAMLVAQSATDLVEVQGVGASAMQNSGAPGFLWQAHSQPYSGSGHVEGIRFEAIEVQVFKAPSNTPLITLRSLVIRP